MERSVKERAEAQFKNFLELTPRGSRHRDAMVILIDIIISNAVPFWPELTEEDFADIRWSLKQRFVLK